MEHVMDYPAWVKERADVLVARVGISSGDTGPHVDQLREWVRQRVSQGMANMSGGTWAAGSETLTPDERAKAFLSFMWSVDRYSYPVQSVDTPVRVVTDVRTWRRRIRVDWSDLVPWLLDRARGYRVRVKRLLDRHVFGVKNPYA